MDRLAIVVPCYNEEEVIGTSMKELTTLLGELVDKKKISDDSFILCVDDGSKDKTWQLIEELHEGDSRIMGLKLAGNVGHQNALTAGMLAARKESDMLISIDADLQDDIAVIEEMIDRYYEGNDIVYGVRNDRKSDSFFKRASAQMFYKVMRWMGVKTVYNHADFRLMSKRAVDGFAEYKEINLYLRGIVPLIGYRTEKVYYSRKQRMAGESKYPFKKMIALAFNGITSFSIKPINFIMTLGMFIIICSMIAAIYALVSYFFGRVSEGWTSLILSIWFIGGVQLFSIGMIGQYIGKIYMEVKNRPRYNVETNMLKKKNKKKKDL